jgi:hypothetical protein
MLARGLSYEFKGTQNFSRLGDGNFVPPPYDLAEIARCSDVEPYVAQSVRRHREQILKEGFEINGQDDEMVNYIKERLFEMALVTGIPTTNWIREAVTNLITYHNCMLIFRRDSSRAKGRTIELYGKILDPIAGVYIVDPTSVSVIVDKNGTPKKWKQKVSGGDYNSANDEKTFNPEDVLFITMDKKSGFTFGTPYILPVLEDIRALRKLEELALILANKEAFPLYHYKVGSELHPATTLDNGSDEIELVKAEVAGMGIGGNLVTSERHEIALVSKQGSALDIDPFLKYFEARVLAGLRLSPMELGRTGSSNKSCYSADTQTLTENGWKHYWEINIDTDYIATMNPTTNELVFVKANSEHIYSHKGEMILFENRNVSVLVTNDHDMWIANDHLSDFKKVHAEDITKNVIFQSKVDWRGYEATCGAFEGLDWPIFLAFFVKFGKVNPVKGEIKLIIRNTTHANSVKAFFLGTGTKHRVYDNDGYTKICIDNSVLARQLNKDFSCKTYPKRLPRYLVDAPTDMLQVFFETLMSFEPCEDIYHDRSKVILGQLQEILLKIGIFSKQTEEGLLIDENISYLPVDITHKKIVPYDGAVYCYNVPGGLFITRRNGLIGIHGNTANNLSKNVQDAAKDYQEVFSNAVSYGIILQLLLEGGYDVTHENMVTMTFATIDREELRMHQNHGLQLMLGNAINEDEFRKEYLNKKPMSDEERNLTPRILDQEMQMELEAHAASVMPTPEAPGDPGPEVTKTVTRKSGTPERNTTTKKVTKLAGNKGQPENQHGKMQAKPRFPINDYISALRSSSEDLKEKLVSIVTQYEDEINPEDISDDISKLFKDFVAVSMVSAKEWLSKNIDEGLSKAAVLDSKTPAPIGNRSKEKFFTHYVEKSYWQVVNPLIESILGDLTRDLEGHNRAFDVLPRLIAFTTSGVAGLASEHSTVATRYGFAKACRTFGYNSIILENESADRKIIELPQGPIIYKNLIVDNTESYQLALGTKPTNE